MTGIVITPDHDIRVEDFHEPLYKTVGKAVGGYIEHVRAQMLPYPYCLLVNEDGWNLGLSLNTMGTALHGLPIVGTIVIMKDGMNADGEPDIIGLSDDDVLRIMQYLLSMCGSFMVSVE